MTESTFWSDIDRLTSASHKIVHRDHGTEVLTGDGLIQQLRDAVAQGMEGGGSSSAFGSRPPIDAAAKDLLREISGQAQVALQAATGLPAPFGGPEKHIRLWGAAVNESTLVTVVSRRQVKDRVVDEWYREGKQHLHRAVFKSPSQMTAEKLVKHWISRIESFFFPPDTFEIKAACPSCETRYVQREKDGQTVQSAAMVFVREDGEILHAKCLECGLTWAKDKFDWLASAAGATKVPDVEKGQIWVRKSDKSRFRVVQVTPRLMDANVKARNLRTGRTFTILATRLADRFTRDTPEESSENTLRVVSK